MTEWIKVTCELVTTGAAVYVAYHGIATYRQSLYFRRQELFALWEQRFLAVADVFADIEDDVTYATYVDAAAVETKGDHLSSTQRDLLRRLDKALRFLLLCRLDTDLVRAEEFGGLTSIYRYYWQQITRNQSVRLYVQNYYSILSTWP